MRKKKKIFMASAKKIFNIPKIFSWDIGLISENQAEILGCHNGGDHRELPARIQHMLFSLHSTIQPAILEKFPTNPWPIFLKNLSKIRRYVKRVLRKQPPATVELPVAIPAQKEDLKSNPPPKSKISSATQSQTPPVREPLTRDDIRQNDLLQNDLRLNDLHQNDLHQNDLHQTDLLQNDLHQNDIRQTSSRTTSSRNTSSRTT